MIDVHTAHISRLENAKYTPSVEVLKKLADVFEVTTDFLLSENNDNDTEVKIENKTLFEKVKLIETLDEDDQQVIMKIIDSLLTKKKIADLITKEKTTA